MRVEFHEAGKGLHRLKEGVLAREDPDHLGFWLINGVDGREYSAHGTWIEPLSSCPVEDTETNAHGGRQSALGARADLLPPSAVLRVAEVLKAGADKYGTDNWRRITTAEHLNHALCHALEWLKTHTQEDLDHAACRLLMALDISLVGIAIPSEGSRL